MILSCDDAGSGPVVVLLHGFPLSRAMWGSQAAFLAPNYRVISPDLRGHGESEAPPGPYSIDQMADDVLQTLDSIGVDEPIALGGLSMGGYVALSIATRHPERLGSLMLMNTKAGADAPEMARGRLELARSVESSGSIDAVVKAMLPKFFSADTHRAHPELDERFRLMMERTTPSAVAATLRALADRPDRTGQLGTIAIPTLIIAGELDELIPLDVVRRMAGEIPGASLVEVAGSGHLSPVEKPAVVNDAIARFLA